MQKISAKKLLSMAVSVLMLLSAFAAPIAQIGAAYAYSTLPFTYSFESSAEGSTDQKAVKITFKDGIEVTGVDDSKIEVNDNFAQNTMVATVEDGGIKLVFGKIGAKDEAYEVTIPAEAVTYDGNFQQPSDYVIEFTAADLNPGMKTLFVDNASFVQSDIFGKGNEYNSLYDVVLSHPGEKISEIKVVHQAADAMDQTSGEYITNIVVAATDDVAKVKISFVDLESGIIVAEEDMQSAAGDKFVSSVMGIKGARVDMDLVAYDSYGKILKEKSYRMINEGQGINNSALDPAPAYEGTYGELLETSDFESFLNGITDLDDVKVSYKDFDEMKRVSDVNELVEALHDTDVNRVVMDAGITSATELTCARAGKDMYIEGNDTTYNGELVLGDGTDGQASRIYIEDIDVNGDITVDVGDSGEAFFDNVTLNGLVIESSDDVNCVHLKDTVVEDLEILNTTPVKVVLEGTTQITNTKIQPEDATKAITIADETEDKGAFGNIVIDKETKDDNTSYAPIVKIDGVESSEIAYGDNMSDADKTATEGNVEEETAGSESGTGGDTDTEPDVTLELICSDTDVTVKDLNAKGGLELTLVLSGEGAVWDTYKKADIRTALAGAMAATNLGIDNEIANATITFTGGDRFANVKIPVDTEFAYGKYDTAGITSETVTLTVADLADAFKGAMKIDTGIVVANGDSLSADVTMNIAASADISGISIASMVQDGTDAKITLSEQPEGDVEYLIGRNTSASTWKECTITTKVLTVALSEIAAGDALYIREAGQAGTEILVGNLAVKGAEVSGVTFSFDDGILASSTTAMEYSLDGGLNWTAVESDGDTLTTTECDSITAANGIKVRTAATANTVAGDVFDIAITEAEAPTSIAFEFATGAMTGTTDGTGDDLMEFSLDGGTTWTDVETDDDALTLTEINDLTAANDLKIRVKAAGTVQQSDAQTIDILAGPAVTTVALDFAAEATTAAVPATIEWNDDNNFDTANTDGDASTLTVVDGEITPGTDLYFRTKATGTTMAGEVQTLTVADRAAAPTVSLNDDTSTAATFMKSSDGSGDQVATADGYEYTTDGGTGWNDITNETIVNASADATITVRVKATDSAFASTESGDLDAN